MGKEIVVITGSPRKTGNGFAMTDTFIKTAEEKRHTAVRFDSGFKKVGGCRACKACYSKDVVCSFDDDLNTIALPFWALMQLYLRCLFAGIQSPLKLRA